MGNCDVSWGIIVVELSEELRGSSISDLAGLYFEDGGVIQILYMYRVFQINGVLSAYNFHLSGTLGVFIAHLNW